MHFDPRDPKSYMLYSMMSEDMDEETQSGRGCGCPTVGLVLLSGLALVLFAAFRA